MLGLKNGETALFHEREGGREAKSMKSQFTKIGIHDDRHRAKVFKLNQK